MFCAQSRPTNKGNRKQKPITKKMVEFHNQFVLLTMVYTRKYGIGVKYGIHVLTFEVVRATMYVTLFVG